VSLPDPDKPEPNRIQGSVFRGLSRNLTPEIVTNLRTISLFRTQGMVTFLVDKINRFREGLGNRFLRNFGGSDAAAAWPGCLNHYAAPRWKLPF
jgi:hypothetical protein